MKLHFPSSLTLLAVAVCIFSGISLTSANKTKPCDITGCREGETCRLGKCIKTTKCEEECLTTPCKSGFYCDENGKCIKDPPCDLECAPGEECYLQQVQCFVAPCPPVPSCRPVKCASVNCPDGEVCENGECVLDPRCASTQCLTGTYCYKGSCFSETPCKEGQCGSAEKCYIGHEECPKPPCPSKVICRFDKCAIVKCRDGYECKNGACIRIKG